MKDKYFLSFANRSGVIESYTVKLTPEEYEAFFRNLVTYCGGPMAFTLCKVTFFRDINYSEAAGLVQQHLRG